MKHISFLLVLCLLVCCVACSAEETPPASDNMTTAATTVATTVTPTTTTEATTEATTGEATTTTETTAIIPTTQNSTSKKTTATIPLPSIRDGREYGAEGTTKDGFGWRRYQSLYFIAHSADYLKLKEHLDEKFGSDRSVVILSYGGADKKRAVIPETIDGFPVVTIKPFGNRTVKEVVLHKYIIVCNWGAFPNATDFYMPEEFLSGLWPKSLDEWPEKGMTYHIPAASPLAAQLREKLTAAGVSHDLLTKGAIGVLDLSGVDAIDADGKLSFE